MNLPPKKNPARSIRPKITPWLLTVFVWFGGLSLTAELWRQVQRDDADNLRAEFEFAADRAASNILSRFHSYEMIMRGVKGFFEGSEKITFEEFNTFVRALRLNQGTGIVGIGLVRIVSDAEKGRHVASMREQGVPNYTISPSGRRDRYAPIVRMEPMAGDNLKALGFDILTVPAARAALAKARDLNDVAITAKMTLIQDSGKPQMFGFVMYLPIYQQGARHETLAERRAAIEGWVDVPFRMNDLMAGLRSVIDPDIDLEIHDGEPLSGQTMMYHSDGIPRDKRQVQGHLQTRRQMAVGGRDWTLVMNTTPAYENRILNGQRSLLVIMAGVVLSLILSVLVWLLARGGVVARVRYRQLFDQAGDGVLLVARNYRFIDANAAALKLLGYTREELLKLRLPDILAKHEVARVKPTAVSLMAGKPHLQEWTHVRKDGSEFPAEVNVRWLDDHYYFAILRDLSERKKAEQQLRLSAQVFEASRDGIVITDEHNDIVAVNQAFTEITGYAPEEVIGKNPRLTASGLQDKAFYEKMWRKILNKGHWQGEVTNQRKNGEIYPQWLSINVIRDSEGRIAQYIGILSDLTEYKAAEARIKFLSNFDPLTQLPNRALLCDRTQLALATAHRQEACTVLAYIDIDRFKIVNDSLGPNAGDQLLKQLSARLIEHLHPDDTLSRQGGDEFILLLPNTDAEGAAHVAQKLLKLIAQPITVCGQELTLTASIGLAQFPQDGADFEQLAQSADAAMFRAKQNGRNNFQFFTRQLHEHAKQVLQIENELRRALERDELLLHYQPQVDAQSLKIIGAEALVRWQHPEQGMVPPGRFIPIAEESDLIGEIGDWVLTTVVRQLTEWQAAGLPVVPVAVNFSVVQFRQDSVYEKVAQVLREFKLDPALLELEMTEGVAMENLERTTGMLKKLHALGVTLSIDDFGTGYSSLSYLKRFKIDKLKIDQSFVRDLGRDPEDEAIVTTIIGMAKSLGFKTIAEGVETREQLVFLQDRQCDEIQGYFFSKPVPAEAFEVLLRTGIKAVNSG